MQTLGIDFGASALKIEGALGGTQVLSQVATNSGHRVARMMGLKSKRPPMHITSDGRSFYCDHGAHDEGRPVESMDYDRLTGTPEMVALFRAGLTRYAQQHGYLDMLRLVTVGLPLEPLTGDQAAVRSTVEAVKRWVIGEHEWTADGMPYEATIDTCNVTSQPVGALFDYLMDGDGRIIPARRAMIKREIGIVSVGFNTVELLVVRDRAPVQKFTLGTTSGVRRLLEMSNNRLYSLGELDAQLRAGQLSTASALPVWAREVGGVIESTWGTAWQRFAAIIVVGGGAILLHSELQRRFAGKASVPDDPVMSIARGLYKLGLSQSKRDNGTPTVEPA